MITSLSYFIEKASKKPPKKLVIAAAEDKYIIQALNKVNKLNIIKPVLIGSKNKIFKYFKEYNFEIRNIEIINEPDPQKASLKSVQFVRGNNDCILMKGLVKSSVLLKEIINKKHGILKEKLLSHLGLIESPYYHKLIGVTDAAINIKPDIHHKIEIIKNAVIFYNSIGIKKPKIAIVAAIETKNDKIKSTIHAQTIKKYFLDKNINNCIVDGPLALDNAISKEAAKHKAIKSNVAGDADILVTPDIDSGNILYKSLNFLGGAITASFVLGAKVPIVFTSRSDSEITKLNSIIVAVTL